MHCHFFVRRAQSRPPRFRGAIFAAIGPTPAVFAHPNGLNPVSFKQKRISFIIFQYLTRFFRLLTLG
jgi:hypothetical protein